MVEQARTLRVTKIFNLAGNIYAFDSTTIYETLQILGISLTDTTPLQDLGIPAGTASAMTKFLPFYNMK